MASWFFYLKTLLNFLKTVIPVIIFYWSKISINRNLKLHSIDVPYNCDFFMMKMFLLVPVIWSVWNVFSENILIYAISNFVMHDKWWTHWWKTLEHTGTLLHLSVGNGYSIMVSWMFHIIFIQVVYQSWVIIVPNKHKILIIMQLIDFNSLVVAITRLTWTYRLMWTNLTVLVNHKSFQQLQVPHFSQNIPPCTNWIIIWYEIYQHQQSCIKPVII